MVSNLPFLAEGLDQIVGLLQVVSGDHREQVVVNLVLKSTTEPIDKELRKAVSTGNVTGGGDLKLPEVWSGFGIVDGHTIVSQTEHNGQEESTRASHGHEKTEGVKAREASESGNEGNSPGVVNDKSDLLEDRVLKSLGFTFELGVLGSGSDSVGILERFIQPGKTGEQQDREVKVLLTLDHELDKSRILTLVEFSERLSLLDGPSQHRHGVNIGITILREGTRVVEVRDGVVTVVLVLPPLHGVTLHDTTPEESRVVTVSASLVDLVVQEVVRQPSALLEEKSHPQGGSNVNKSVLREGHHSKSGQEHGKVGGLLVNVEPEVALEHSHDNELRSKVSVGLLERALVVVLVFNTLYNKASDKELLQKVFRSLGVEGSKDISGIVTGMGEDDGTTGVVTPVGNVVDLVVVDDPSIVGSRVLLHIGPSVLWHLLQLVLALKGDSCITSFTHGCVFLCSMDKTMTVTRETANDELVENRANCVINRCSFFKQRISSHTHQAGFLK